MRTFRIFVFLFSFSLMCAQGCSGNEEDNVVFCPEGSLKERVERNLTRLEGDKYLPENVFLTEEESLGWPGDTEGRTILGLVCDSKAAGHESPNLAEIISLIPAHLNERGYMGTDYGDVIDEQQISGHGWMLRGLCAYYRYAGDESVLSIIRSISENLFVRHAGRYRTYPISPSERDGDGGASGHISGSCDGWRLSSDIGCLFIGLDGLVDAYGLTGGDELKVVIEEMIGRFLEMDIVGIKAQAHASLTGCRALVCFAELTENDMYIHEAQKRWLLYKKYGMTENYANYNWLTRYDTWTEPCAIVDSYILALKLWEHTSDTSYLEDAHMIWYNAICHAQRHNGGFGCDTCPGEASGCDLKVFIDEAHWCCTMRGAEALLAAVESLAFSKEDQLVITSYHDGTIRSGNMEMQISTDYPCEGVTLLDVRKGKVRKGSLKLFMPSWMKVEQVKVDGKPLCDEVVAMNDGFLSFNMSFRAGDQVTLEYSLTTREEACINSDNSPTFGKRRFVGPLLLDENGNPIYHLMSDEVNVSSGYKRRVIN